MTITFQIYYILHLQWFSLHTSIIKPILDSSGLTQNVLAVMKPDLQFTYVLAGWEGFANDFTVLRDVLSRLQPEGLKVIEDVGQVGSCVLYCA
ncbi:hypothetical protein IHE45_19G062400 [Dioscorea alata]|uniref:Uncharacterized protein n=1 Tax=Dioscorea alata TaxID=55571 RepID=A0ACB7TYY4_DIOAL|nr:hypothetical protein IHE45_19G062400 [Dioscorea alata]